MSLVAIAELVSPIASLIEIKSEYFAINNPNFTFVQSKLSTQLFRSITQNTETELKRDKRSSLQLLQSIQSTQQKHLILLAGLLMTTERDSHTKDQTFRRYGMKTWSRIMTLRTCTPAGRSRLIMKITGTNFSRPNFSPNFHQIFGSSREKLSNEAPVTITQLHSAP